MLRRSQLLPAPKILRLHYNDVVGSLFRTRTTDLSGFLLGGRKGGGGGFLLMESRWGEIDATSCSHKMHSAGRNHGGV